MNRKNLDESNISINPINFGQVSSGNIKIKPLTIFIGPNNSGKSYVAMLIYSLYNSFNIDFPKYLMPYGRIFENERLFYEIFEDLYFGRLIRSKNTIRDTNNYINQLVNELVNEFDIKTELSDIEKFLCNKKNTLIVSDSLLNKIYGKYLRQVCEENLKSEIEKSFNCKIRKLIKIGKRKMQLKLRFDSDYINISTYRDNLKIEEFSIKNLKISIRKSSKKIGKDRRAPYRIGDVKKNSKNDYTIYIFHKIDEKNKNVLLTYIMYMIQSICRYHLYQIGKRGCYFLPAARSGILQGHKALMAGLIEQSSRVFIEGMDIPKFSGVVSDFLKSIINMPEMEKGIFYDLATELEQELLHGEVKYQSTAKAPYPEIIYEYQKSEIPLYRTSSTISELAPLILYLKYKVKPGDKLIIEEPEAHLHPENQRLLAKYIVKLIRRNVTLIITTHSDYFLRQLNNFIKLSKITKEKRIKKYDYTKDLFIMANEVSAYIFHLNEGKADTKIKSISISERDGISHDEFLKIDESLYEETVKIERDLK